MHVITLQSGSNGNCTYVESRGVRLLFDAGISERQARLRLAECGRDISAVDALLISHEHGDHSRCMPVFHRKHGLPVYVTEKTLQASTARCDSSRLKDVRHFTRGDRLQFGHVTVETIPTPHDAVDAAAFVVDDGSSRLGILIDLGHVFTDLPAILDSLDAVILESNYDPKMLRDGRYPDHLQERIRGPGGHLSNDDSAELLNTVKGNRLKWACLAHLSGDNNTPEKALAAHRKLLRKNRHIFAASRSSSSGLLEL